MNYPLISEYEREIKTKGSVILKLPQHYDFVPNKIKPIKIYSYGSGAMNGETICPKSFLEWRKSSKYQ